MHVRPAVVLTAVLLSAAPMACASTEAPFQAIPAAIRVQLAVASVRLPEPSKFLRTPGSGRTTFLACLPASAAAIRTAPAPNANVSPHPAPAPAAHAPQVPLSDPMGASRPANAP